LSGRQLSLRRHKIDTKREGGRNVTPQLTVPPDHDRSRRLQGVVGAKPAHASTESATEAQDHLIPARRYGAKLPGLKPISASTAARIKSAGGVPSSGSASV